MKKSVVVLLHIGYWLLYLLLLGLIVLCMSLGSGLKLVHPFSHLGFNLFIATFAVVPAVIGFYFYYHILFIYYLTKKKIGLFFSGAVVAALLAGMVGGGVLMVLFSMKIGPGITHDGLKSAIPITIIMAIIALLNGVVGLVMKGFISWYGDIKLKEDLNKKNYETELALVKSQISPHFLFNTINNIDVLIEKDAVKASAYLNKLSGMMRFMLYETKTEKIPLQKELDYIRQYISLQQIRVANPGYIDFKVSGNAAGRMIHSMLFIPFIENAFKHNSDHKSNGAIQIAFVIEAGHIIFTCKNTCGMEQNNQQEHSGVGNELIVKRLTLLYGPKHQLQVDHQPGNYSVTLIIQTV